MAIAEKPSIFALMGVRMPCNPLPMRRNAVESKRANKGESVAFNFISRIVRKWAGKLYFKESFLEKKGYFDHLNF
jgi:hypothetical protein